MIYSLNFKILCLLQYFLFCMSFNQCISKHSYQFFIITLAKISVLLFDFCLTVAILPHAGSHSISCTNIKMYFLFMLTCTRSSNATSSHRYIPPNYFKNPKDTSAQLSGYDQTKHRLSLHEFLKQHFIIDTFTLEIFLNTINF